MSVVEDIAQENGYTFLRIPNPQMFEDADEVFITSPKEVSTNYKCGPYRDAYASI